MKDSSGRYARTRLDANTSRLETQHVAREYHLYRGKPLSVKSMRFLCEGSLIVTRTFRKKEAENLLTLRVTDLLPLFSERTRFN